MAIVWHLLYRAVEDLDFKPWRASRCSIQNEFPREAIFCNKIMSKEFAILMGLLVILQRPMYGLAVNTSH